MLHRLPSCSCDCFSELGACINTGRSRADEAQAAEHSWLPELPTGWITGHSHHTEIPDTQQIRVSAIPQDLKLNSWLQLLHQYCPFNCTELNCSGHNYLFPPSLGVFDRLRKPQPACNPGLNDLIPKTLSWMMAQQLGHLTGICLSRISVLSRLRIVSQSHFQRDLLVHLVARLFTVGS